ncbi:DUF6319 family protein [Glycomyces sp. L485]|uniref:DUF6319 family protein n=1 Tax=Glycomyces sp. L485 TaxID=2909235 RepID=UPI001F4B61F1|nr:DUF6319 family protein [Glycomyces sp. L485]MCH7230293.1 DUF6319 family protein [Glycomyces sp. L485]
MSLSSADVTHLESVLAQGKKPKVMFTDAAGQVAGKSGKVVALDEARDGDFVQVAFGSDQLPFSPAELRLPERGETTRAKTPRQRAPEPAAPPGPGLLPEAPKPKPTERNTPNVPETAPEAKTEAAPRKKAPRQRTAKEKHPELTVTLTYEDGDWAVAAAKGARTLVKGVQVSHAAALAMCVATESADVTDIVTEVVDKIRSEAAEEAEALRKRLEEAEARLAELGSLQ